MQPDDIEKYNQWEVVRPAGLLALTSEEAGGENDAVRQLGEGWKERQATPRLSRYHSALHSTITVCSAQSESDHSATQRERRVAQQDARTSQAKVKPKLSVGV